jgi:uncharacterized protein YuzE
MKVHCDQLADALYLRLDSSRIAGSEEVRPGVILDLDADNQVVGIELLRVSERTTPENLQKITVRVA